MSLGDQDDNYVGLLWHQMTLQQAEFEQAQESWAASVEYLEQALEHVLDAIRHEKLSGYSPPSEALWQEIREALEEAQYNCDNFKSWLLARRERFEEWAVTAEHLYAQLRGRRLEQEHTIARARRVREAYETKYKAITPVRKQYEAAVEHVLDATVNYRGRLAPLAEFCEAVWLRIVESHNTQQSLMLEAQQLQQGGWLRSSKQDAQRQNNQKLIQQSREAHNAILEEVLNQLYS